MNNGYQQHFKKIQNQKTSANHSMNISNHVQNKKNKQNRNSLHSGAELGAQQIASKELRDQIQSQIKLKKTKRSKSSPKGIVLFSILGLVVTYFGLNNLNDIENFVKKAEISLFGYAAAEEKPEAKDASKAAQQSKEPEKKVADEQTQAKREFTDEEINHFTKLNDRKKELDAREEELNRMEAELQAQKSELEKRLGELNSTRRDISSVLDDKVKADDQKVDSLVSVYSSMKPQQAAKVFETMDEDLAIEILGRMKKKPAAEILNLVKAEKAQVLSERYAGYKRK